MIDKSEMTREYRCGTYRLKAHPHSCFFCDNCTDIFYDYTNGPYMFFCAEELDIDTGLSGSCKQFSEVDS